MTKPHPQTIVIAPSTFWLFLGVCFLLGFLFLIREVLVLIFIACLLASALSPAVGWLRTKHLTTSLSIILLYLAFVLFLMGVIILVTNVAINEGGAFIENIPMITDRITIWLNHIPGFRGGDRLLGMINNNLQAITTQTTHILLSTLNYFRVFLQGFLELITVLVLTYFLISQPEKIEHGIIRLLPSSIQPRISCFLRSAALKTGAYVRGQLLVAGSVGLLIWLGLLLMGVPYAPVLGLLAFILDVIPILGSLLASVFGILVALGISPIMAVWTALLYLGVNQLEANFFSPWIVGQSVGLSPFWILISILIGGILYGPVGIILAIPLAVVVNLCLESFYLPQNSTSAPL